MTVATTRPMVLGGSMSVRCMAATMVFNPSSIKDANTISQPQINVNRKIKKDRKNHANQ